VKSHGIDKMMSVLRDALGSRRRRVIALVVILLACVVALFVVRYSTGAVPSDLLKDFLSLGLIVFVGAKLLDWCVRYTRAIWRNPEALAAERADLRFLGVGVALIISAFVFEFGILRFDISREAGPVTQFALVFVGAIVLGCSGIGFILEWFARRQRFLRTHTEDKQ
jgi:hypothetical protein